MRHLDIIHAWKNEEYRLSLSEAERALLSAHPAGLMELTDAQLDDATGGFTTGMSWGMFAKLVASYLFGYRDKYHLDDSPRYNPAEH